MSTNVAACQCCFTSQDCQLYNDNLQEYFRLFDFGHTSIYYKHNKNNNSSNDNNSNDKYSKLTNYENSLSNQISHRHLLDNNNSNNNKTGTRLTPSQDSQALIAKRSIASRPKYPNNTILAELTAGNGRLKTWLWPINFQSKSVPEPLLNANLSVSFLITFNFAY